MAVTISFTNQGLGSQHSTSQDRSQKEETGKRLPTGANRSSLHYSNGSIHFPFRTLLFFSRLLSFFFFFSSFAFLSSYSFSTVSQQSHPQKLRHRQCRQSKIRACAGSGYGFLVWVSLGRDREEDSGGEPSCCLLQNLVFVSSTLSTSLYFWFLFFFYAVWLLGKLRTRKENGVGGGVAE